MNRMSIALAVSLTTLPLAVSGSIPATAAPPPRTVSVAATERQREIAGILSVLGGRTAEVAKRAAAIPLGRLATVEDVAELTAFLASDGAGYVTGQAINVAGGAVTH